MTTSDTNLSNLIINKLTKAQYESISTPSPTELYMVTDEPIDSETMDDIIALDNDKEDVFDTQSPVEMTYTLNGVGTLDTSVTMNSDGTTTIGNVEEYYGFYCDSFGTSLPQTDYWKFNFRIKRVSASVSDQPFFAIDDAEVNFVELYFSDYNLPTDTWVQCAVIHQAGASTVQFEYTVNGTTTTAQNVLASGYTLANNKYVNWMGIGITVIADLSWNTNYQLEPYGVRNVFTDRTLGVNNEAFDAKVNKSGDTMTGALELNVPIPSGDNTTRPVVLKNTEMAVGTVPSSATFTTLQFTDTNDVELGRMTLRNTTTERELVLVNTGFNGSTTTLKIGMNTSNTPYCTFPNTTCVDGQWTNVVAQNIVSGSNITWTSGHNYDLSNYLPNDGHVYEVIFTASWIGSTSGANHELRASTDIITSTWNWLGRISGQNAACGMCILPVGTKRYIKLTTASNGKACNSVYFSALGYRRLGTNS